jgi:hypothetical protein
MKSDISPESIRIEDTIYSAKKLAAIHPGGPLFIKVAEFLTKFLPRLK